MGTGNKDEDYGVGYYTLTGDGLVHMNPIGFLSKRLVRELGAELGFPPRIVNRTPTAGLEPEQTDEGDLGYAYEFVELVVEGLDQGFALTDIVNHPQLCVSGLLSNGPKAKWHNNPDGRLHAVLDVLVRHDIAKAKAALVRPKVPDIVLPKE
jgi:NH3-dependent NAD+ synthetase